MRRDIRNGLYSEVAHYSYHTLCRTGQLSFSLVTELPNRQATIQHHPHSDTSRIRPDAASSSRHFSSGILRTYPTMADAEEKVRQEKIAAAKKRVRHPLPLPPHHANPCESQVEQMKKNKKKGTASKKAKPEAAETPAVDAVEETPEAPASDEKAIQEAPEEKLDESAVKEPESLLEEPSKDDSEEQSPSATPSLAQQSKLRSTSFRVGSSPSGGAPSPVPFSPDGDTAPEIYRKHVARIEDLEKENKRLAKEASDSEKRWQKAEEELADIRDDDSDDADGKGESTGQLDKLVRICKTPDARSNG